MMLVYFPLHFQLILVILIIIYYINKSSASPLLTFKYIIPPTRAYSSPSIHMPQSRSSDAITQKFYRKCIKTQARFVYTNLFASN